MLTASFTVDVDIAAPPAEVFAYVADLTKHPGWSANPLEIESLNPGPVAVGARYRSKAQANGVTFTAEPCVVEYQPPLRFAFKGEDRTGRFEHRFTLQPYGGGTRLSRTVIQRMTLAQWVTFQVLRFSVRLPAARKALRQLKQQVEGQNVEG